MHRKPDLQHSYSSATATGHTPPPAEGSCASRKEKQRANPCKAPVVSHFHAICMLQTDVSWCFLWFKDVGQSQGWFSKGGCWHLSWTIDSNMQVFKYLPQSLGIDNPGGMTFLNGGLESSTCHRGSVMTGNSAGTHPAPSLGVLINSLPFSTHNSSSPSARWLFRYCLTNR